MGDFNESIEMNRAAVAEAEDDVLRGGMSSNLCRALETRFDNTGVLTDLDDAIRAARMSVRLMPAADPTRTARLAGLCSSVPARYLRTGAAADIDEAVRTGLEAEAVCEADLAHRAAILCTAADASRSRFSRTKNVEDIHITVRLYRDAFSVTHGAPDGGAGCPLWASCSRIGSRQPRRLHRLPRLPH